MSANDTPQPDKQDANGHIPINKVDNLSAIIERFSARLAELEATVEELDGQLQELQSHVEMAAPDPATVEYDRLERHQKVTLIQRGLVEEAQRNGGKAGWNYREVKQRFDGQPSDKHCYDLMESAAERDGFNYGTSKLSDHKRVTVDLASVQDPESLLP